MTYCVICGKEINKDKKDVIWTERKSKRTYAHQRCFDEEQLKIKAEKEKK